MSPSIGEMALHMAEVSRLKVDLKRTKGERGTLKNEVEVCSHSKGCAPRLTGKGAGLNQRRPRNKQIQLDEKFVFVRSLRYHFQTGVSEAFCFVCIYFLRPSKIVTYAVPSYQKFSIR